MSPCDNCSHAYSSHVGYTYMGGGHGEVLGCMEIVDKEKQIPCDCPLSPEELDEMEAQS